MAKINESKKTNKFKIFIITIIMIAITVMVSFNNQTNTPAITETIVVSTDNITTIIPVDIINVPLKNVTTIIPVDIINVPVKNITTIIPVDIINVPLKNITINNSVEIIEFNSTLNESLNVTPAIILQNKTIFEHSIYYGGGHDKSIECVEYNNVVTNMTGFNFTTCMFEDHGWKNGFCSSYIQNNTIILCLENASHDADGYVWNATATYNPLNVSVLNETNTTL